MIVRLMQDMYFCVSALPRLVKNARRLQTKACVQNLFLERQGAAGIEPFRPERYVRIDAFEVPCLDDAPVAALRIREFGLFRNWVPAGYVYSSVTNCSYFLAWARD